jgi:hypothetical protein
VELNGNAERLQKSFSELVELQLVLEKAGSFFDDAQQRATSAAFDRPDCALACFISVHFHFCSSLPQFHFCSVLPHLSPVRNQCTLFSLLCDMFSSQVRKSQHGQPYAQSANITSNRGYPA